MIRVFVFSLIIVVSVFGCTHPDSPSAPTTPLPKLLATASVFPASIIAAVGDTLNFNSHAISITGDTISNDSIYVTWNVSDPAVLKIDRSGRGIALKHSSGNIVNVIATIVSNGVTRNASSLVLVTPVRQPISRLVISARDSTAFGSGSIDICCGININGYGSEGESFGLIRAPLIPNVTKGITFGYLGSTGALLGLGQYFVQSKVIGKYWLKTEAYVYGTLLNDSLEMLGLYPSDAVITISQDSGSVDISSLQEGYTALAQPCATIRFANKSNQPISVEFDDSTKASGCLPTDLKGKIPSIGPNANGDRKFPNLGKVSWVVRALGPGAGGRPLTGNVEFRVPEL